MPESGSNRERLDGCSSSSINAASLHFTKVGQIKSHSGYIHLASKSNVSVLPHMVIRACSMLVDLKQLELFKLLARFFKNNLASSYNPSYLRDFSETRASSWEIPSYLL